MRDNFRKLKNRNPTSWSWTRILKRDQRHIHSEEIEHYYKPSRRKKRDRSRCKHEMVECGTQTWSWYKTTYYKCKHCARKSRMSSYTSQYTDAQRERMVADYRARYPRHAYYGRTHHGKYKRNREHLVQDRGF